MSMLSGNVEIISHDKASELDAFIAAHPEGHFMQTSRWGALKSSWTWVAVAKRNESGVIVGSMSFLIRKAPLLPCTLMYGCRGPVCFPNDYDTLRDLLTAAKTLARTFRSYSIKLDPDVPVGNKAFTDLLESLGYRHLEKGKSFEGVQPRFVFRLNIEGLSEDELMARFSSKTRYNIRLAARKGVAVKRVGEAGLDDFSALMVETGVRDNFVTRPREYFARMLTVMGEHARLYMAYHEGQAIAGALAVWYGDKVWYLYGASSNSHRNLMPNYALQWEMIRWAAEKNCRIYDFRGVSGDLSEDNPLYGLYRFKRGFNGDFCEFAGEFDYISSPLLYKGIDLGQKFIKLRAKKKYMRKNAAKVPFEEVQKQKRSENRRVL